MYNEIRIDQCVKRVYWNWKQISPIFLPHKSILFQYVSAICTSWKTHSKFPTNQFQMFNEKLYARFNVCHLSFETLEMTCAFKLQTLHLKPTGISQKRSGKNKEKIQTNFLRKKLCIIILMIFEQKLFECRVVSF